MKKIMFNDKFGLTKAVLEGRKTMTRRIVPGRYLGEFPNEVDLFEAIYNGHAFMKGEVVAVAQPYKDCVNEILVNWGHKTDIAVMVFRKMAGWKNKMFVRADLMPHRIRITNVRVERLQDISDEDCLREGITTKTEGKYEPGNGYGWDTFIDALKRDSFFTPKAAFAALIDKVSGKCVWDSNPFVFVYEFELVK